MKISPYKIRLAVAGIIGILSVLAICGIFYPIRIMDIQFVPVMQRLIIDFSIVTAVLFGIIVVITILFGRLYCSIICPFGILQEFGARLLHRFGKGYFPNKWGREKWDDIPLRYLIAGLMFGTSLGGSVLLIKYIDPYTIVCSAFSLSIFGIIAVLAILSLVFFKNRFFCTNICPVGAVLGIISKISLNKIYIDENCDKCEICASNCPAYCIIQPKNTILFKGAKDPLTIDNETCLKCLKCMSVCSKGAIKYGIQPVKFNPKRRDFIWGIGALALLGAGYSAGINFTKNVAKKVKDIILPAGAENTNRMANKCLNCNLCINNCPNGILTKADENFSVVHIDYKNGKHYCEYNCHKCSQVCPTGAIKKISLEEKQNTRIAMASISPHCVGCRRCETVCPADAILMLENKAVIDESKCIGCGKCAIVCGSQVISMFAVNEQSRV